MDLLKSHDSKPRQKLPSPRMLKDYLLDDLSSCSSNGFRSFPRRQCCTTVRFLLENDLRTRDSNRRKRLLRSKSTNTSSTKSAFQRASEAVINAVNLLPFAAVRSPNASKRSKNKSSMLPRSLSRKILQRSFWKRTDKEIERWTSFKYLLEKRKNPSLSPPVSPPAFSPSAVTTTTATDSNRSTNSKSESNSSSDGAFTSDYLLCSSGNSETSIENDVVEGEKRLPEEAVSKRIGVIVGDDSIGATITNSKNKWPIEEEKEQFSPVSVLDVPFEEDEDEVSSPFTRRLSRMEGTKLKLMQKIRRLENLAQLQPVDLENQFSLPEIFTDESTESPSPSSSKLCSNPIQDNIPSDAREKEIDTKRTALDLLELIKATFPSGSFESKSENLLLDLFSERICEANEESDYDQLLNEAKDWVDVPTHDMFLGWEVERNRQAYIRDMEKGGMWSKLDEEREEMALEVEVEVFASLVNEVLVDLFSS
ncbi:Testis-expressed sequence 10 protein [Actinidia chinensis var. chinensis]|uniref:Testis-expressed sequence 10 protein n=1 Tax=Actinidia chinensis var. chinensis TaxID=1590841 RepID=A0A2R6QNE8_ACTCC|nr:Testis-expressed sequence 10 protein [Actinidia chinensis var. chinensis]